MEEEARKKLSADPDGLLTYEYIANHIDTVEPELPWLVENMEKVDLTGQFVKSGIEKDREHRYLGDMLRQMYGPDYAERSEELSTTDDNFRRIYKRLFPISAI